MNDRLRQAHRMLDAFTSVGADRFDASRIDIDGKLIAFRPDLTVADLKKMLPAAMESAERARHNLVIRPRGSVPLIQLDDLSATQLHLVAPVSFLTVCTSPGNHQAWVAVDHIGEPTQVVDLARRLRKGTGADPNASGSVRLAGSRNFKLKYAPDFPTVAIVDAAPGRTVTPEQLHDMELLAPEAPQTWVSRVSQGTPRRWPDYARCLAGAPPKHSGDGPDISRADFLWCRIAAQNDHTPDEIANELLRESPKAQQAGERYARRTADRAYRSVRDN